jgi:membrane-bound lytic murein transglycosylase D
MRASFPGLLVRVVFVAALVSVTGRTFAQIPVGSSARSIPTDVEKNEARVSQIITQAEDHFHKGKLNLDDSRRDAARDEFDKAVDTILESGLDVRATQRLQDFYLQLVERIYREEVPIGHGLPQAATTALVAQNGQTPSSSPQPSQNPASTPQVGFREQKFEPSPLDELSKLVLTAAEQNVSEADVAALEQARNNVNFSFTIHPEIQQYINYYQGRGRSTMESGLRRSGKFMRMAREIFQKEGVPLDIVWLAQVESAWHEKAQSNKAAVGLWQFIPAAGSTYGLRQSAWIDERNSYEQATHASARYLKDLAKRYNGDWELAMAAYNTGAGHVDRAIARAGTASFWAIYPYIFPETRNYVPNILAVILIAKNPAKYGFEGIKPEAPMAYDRVELPTATSLQLIADATDSTVDYLRSINPELRRDVTPRGELYVVRVPGGKARQLANVIKRIPGDKRETARVISIAPGEDFQAVANRTGVSVAQLQAMNTGVELKSTTKLVVPNSNVRLTSAHRSSAPEAEAPGSSSGNLIKIRVRKGDTITRIAAAHRIDAGDLARLNGLPVNGDLKVGTEIKVPAAAAEAPAPGRRRRR